MVKKSDIENVLRSIPDPEIGVSILDLGLIYDIGIDKTGKVTVTMSLTSIGCPLFDLIANPIRQEVGKLSGVTEVEIELTFEPPWTPDLMSKEAKQQLGF